MNNRTIVFTLDSVNQESKEHTILHVKSHAGNLYNYHYYHKDGLVTCNIGSREVNEYERQRVFSILETNNLL